MDHIEQTPEAYSAPEVETIGSVSDFTLFTLTKNGTVADTYSAALGNVPGSDVQIT